MYFHLNFHGSLQGRQDGIISINSVEMRQQKLRVSVLLQVTQGGRRRARTRARTQARTGGSTSRTLSIPHKFLTFKF